MKAGLTISAGAHAFLLLWGMITFVARPMSATPTESLPVDIISATEFSQLTAGVKTAPQAPVPKPLVERVEAPKPTEDPTAKVVDKPEINTASALMPEQTPPPPIPEPKAAPPPPQAEPEPPKKQPEPQQQAAEPVKKEEPKKPEPKKAEPKKPEPKKVVQAKAPQKKPPPPQPQQQQFDANRIAALLDKRAPQRRATTGETINHTATLGTATGAAATLSQNEIDALRAQIQACWNPPAGAVDGRELVVQVKILLKQDGSLAAEPVVLNRGANATFQIAAESAMRAVRRCQPYRLPIAKYDVWKDVEVTFDPRDLFRG